MVSTLADSNVRPHDRFFFSDGSLYLLVENSLYCVHKFFFEVHATMSPVREQETSVSKPCVLGDVKTSDFDCFLATFYPRIPGVEEAETTQDWISILGLASKWGFESLRSRAISKVEQTLESPIDMVTFGRQYGISAFLLPGYAVLCQSTTPLSDEEGLRLGMEDVLKIYRVRHELYGSGITPVPLEAAFAKVKEADLEEERPRQLDGDQASTWTDVGSITASQASTEKEERGAIALTPDVDPPSLEVASTDAATLGSERPGQRHVDAHSPSNKPMSVILGNGGVPPSMFPGNINISNLYSESSESDREGFKLLDELTEQNFDLVFVEIMQWVNTKDIQTLHQITQAIVEKAIKASEYHNPFARLCKAMVKYTQTLHQMTRLIVEMAMDEPCRFDSCAQLCEIMINDYKNGFPTMTAGGLLFGKYLGEICLENLEAVATSVAGTGEHMARVRRLRLIEFIGALANLKAVDMWAPTIIDKWVTALLDANSEEKVATLCMAMTRAGQLCTSREMNGWLRKR